MRVQRFLLLSLKTQPKNRIDKALKIKRKMVITLGSGKRFIKSSFIYFTGNVLTRLVSFFLLPIYTSLISTEDMGYYDYSLSILNILIPVVCFEIWSGIMRFMFEQECEQGKYKTIFNGLILLSCSILLYTMISIGLELNKEINLLFLIYLYGLFIMLQNTYGYIARGFGLNKVYIISGVIASIVTSLINILLMLVFGLRLKSLYIAAISGLAFQILIIELRIKLITNITFSMFDKEILVNMLKFSLPLSLNSISFWFLSSYNRIAITNKLGLSANGIYSISGKFSTMLTLVSTCFSMAWQELAYEKGNDADRGVLYTRAANYYIKFLSAGLLLAIPVISIIFPLMIDESYSEAYLLIPLHLLATCASIFCSFLGNIFGAEKKTGVVMYSTMVAAVVNVFILHLLIKYIGSQAANISLFCGFVVNIILRMILLRNEVELNLSGRDFTVLLFLFIIAVCIYNTRSVIWNFLFFTAVFILYTFVFKDFVKDGIKLLKRRFCGP